jgi:hypothetical protein
VSSNDFQLRGTQPAIEANGLFGGRLYYGVGFSQGSRTLRDDNPRKDFYYKIRYKIGGIRLDGRVTDGRRTGAGRGGQLLDRTLSLEHFGYFGAQRVQGDVDDVHRAFGANVRAVAGPLDIGAGFVWGRNDNPWGTDAIGHSDFWSAFVKGEYLVMPWLFGSLKLEQFETTIGETLRTGGFQVVGDEVRALPGVIALVRQNVRVVIEGELFLEAEASEASNAPKPHTLWLRIDFAF